MHFLVAPVAICFHEAHSFFINTNTKIMIIYIPLTILFFRDIVYLNVGFLDNF